MSTWSDFFRNAEKRNSAISIGDPALAEFVSMGNPNLSGVSVTEQSMLGLSAVYAAVQIMSSIVASLPLKTYRKRADDERERVPSLLDNPGGELWTPYEWTKLAMVHLLLHGNAYLYHVRNASGAILTLQPLHPATVEVDLNADLTKVFLVRDTNGNEHRFSKNDLTHIMGMSLDGVKGVSPIQYERHVIGASLAGDQSAARMFKENFMLGGIVSVPGLKTEEQAEEISTKMQSKLGGPENAGKFAIVKEGTSFSPWNMNAEDAQFIQSRQFQIEEVARIFRMPKTLLAQDGASTWGSGIAELLRAWKQTTLLDYTTPIQQRLSTLIPRGQYAEFDYSGLLAPNKKEQVEIYEREIASGLLTVNEARKLENREPLSDEELAKLPVNNNQPNLQETSGG